MDVVSALAELVAFPTVSDRPVTAIAAWLAQHAEDAGLQVTRFETSPGKANVVARGGPQGTGGGLTLSGHMDVVPVDGQGWSSDPFVLTERDGRLHGRGSCDMKGFLAATHAALADLDLARLRHELVLVWTHDEEVGCHGSRSLADGVAGSPDPLPAATIIGEPTSFRICRAHPGHTTLSIRLHGRPAHSSRPDLGLSAIAAAGRVILAIEALQQRLAAEDHGTDPLVLAALPFPYPVLNCGHVHGGTAVNIVAEHCELRVGVRQLPGQTGGQLVERVAQVALEATEAFRREGGTVQTRMQHEAPAMLTPAGTGLEQLLAGLADDPQPTAVPFATDGGNLERLGARPLVFGPGSIAQAHKADEYVPTDELHRCREILRRVVLDRCLAAPL